MPANYGTGPPHAGGPLAAPPRPDLVVRPRDPFAACCCDVETQTGPVGPILLLRINGEIDMLTIPVIRTALTTALDRGPRDLVVDLAGVRFCCVRGFALFAEIACTASSCGVGYAMSGMTTHLDRVATLLWPDEHLVRYRSAAAAVTAIRIDQTARIA